MSPRPKAVGRCYVCQGPVFVHEAARVADPSTLMAGRMVRRLTHRRECEQDLRTRIARAPRSDPSGWTRG